MLLEANLTGLGVGVWRGKSIVAMVRLVGGLPSSVLFDPKVQMAIDLPERVHNIACILSHTTSCQSCRITLGE